MTGVEGEGEYVGKLKLGSVPGKKKLLKEKTKVRK